MNGRELDVFVESRLVGRLFESTGVWSFAYADAWLQDGFPLAPGLPLQPERIEDAGSTRPVQWYFDNLLPDEMARQRLVAALGKGEWDAWSLLARFGAESAGAITLLAPGEKQAEAALIPLPDEILQQRIVQMPHVSLASTAPKKMSLAGAQEKLPVVLDEHGVLFEPVGSRISTHILKPDALSEHYPASAVNEWYCARVAQQLRFDVPRVELRYVPSAVYLIERFDRRYVNGVLERRHALDAAQLLSLSSGSKYTLAGAEALNRVVDLCRAKAPTRIALFRWTLLNVLLGNHDAHLKNLSLFAGRDGYALAPHYDLVSTVSWARPDLVAHGARWPDVELTHALGEARFFADLRRKHILAFGDAMKLPASIAERELNRLLAQILPAADAIKAEFEKRQDVPSALRAGQLYMIGCIRNVPIAEMSRQLS